MNNSKRSSAARVIAAEILLKVVADGASLNDVLAKAKMTASAQDAALIQELCFGVCRTYFSLQPIIRQLIAKPFKQKDAIIEMILLIGLYQLENSNTPAFAVINETVSACDGAGRSFAKGLVNACLRRFTRDRELKNAAKEFELSAHPEWLYQRIQTAWPDEAATIFMANNQRPPFCLRVNLRQQSRADYLATLQKQGIAARAHPTVPSAILLEHAMAVTAIPGFSEGLVSVQDAASQCAAWLLQPQPGMRVLDACAAPGGKTIHLLQSEPSLELLALDSDAKRLQRVHENCTRAGVKAVVQQADVLLRDSWWNGQLFDRILLDAPCSAVGVIRRHPDIKLLRQDSDIQPLVDVQRKMLEVLAPCVRLGGLLLYSTCSVLPEENHLQIMAFLTEHPEWRDVTKLHPAYLSSACQRVPVGMQIIPGFDEMDGFYYALLERTTLNTAM